MFNKCNKLLSLPDISKWKTNNVTDMSRIFSECSSLTELPDISKWKTNNVTNMSLCLINGVNYYLYLIFQNGMRMM